ncbi:MAG: lipopolysaccharide biosynthesis protein, partial [Sphingomicrobium sp.]
MSWLRTMFAGGRSLLGGRHGIVRSGLWSLVLRVAGLVSGFALGVLLARMLGPAEFGIYGLVTTVAAVGMTVAQLGRQQAGVSGQHGQHGALGNQHQVEPRRPSQRSTDDREQGNGAAGEGDGEAELPHQGPRTAPVGVRRTDAELPHRELR